MSELHLGDDVELAAIGALSADEARVVEAHTQTCDACAERLAGAQQVGAALAAALPAHAPSAALGRRIAAVARSHAPAERRRYGPAVAWVLAAALVAGFVGVGREAVHERQRADAADVALQALLRSHFEHVAMVSHAGPAIAAKVLFARNGSWICVLAERAAGPLRVVGSSVRGAVILGDLAPSGATEALFARPALPLERVELLRGDQIVATAELAESNAR